AEESDTLKTAFLANMSHEIRTPMNGIIGFSEMLAENNLTDEKRKEYAQIVVKSSKQLLALVNDILDISKIEAGEVTISKDIFNVNTLIHDIYIFFKPQAIQKRLEFHEVKSLADSQSVIESDKNRLRQILVNLVSNALKFTHTGEVSFGYSVSNGSITFFVKDTGIGIPKHLQKEIFERFRQAELETTKLYGGTGLGLSISQKLVELLGGTIQLESEPGKGSLFSFTLPYKQEKSNDEIVSQPIGNINFNKATIVIAEDNDTNFQLLEATLSKCNLTIIRAVNGQDAIDICMQNSAVQFVLMDIRMPKIDGITASAEIKKYRPDLPIVIQSAYKANEERKQAIEAGCDEYLSKPIKKHELISCLLRFIPI
ncbi:MAG TPA: ATP-binding protein, partial [Bacteroidales bacterium]|nr:ATP-binding protein [Bacteroidales bacterium]